MPAKTITERIRQRIPVVFVLGPMARVPPGYLRVYDRPLKERKLSRQWSPATSAIKSSIVAPPSLHQSRFNRAASV